MEPDSGSTGGLQFPSDDNSDGQKKSTHLELQEKYGGEAVAVSNLRTANILKISIDMLNNELHFSCNDHRQYIQIYCML